MKQQGGGIVDVLISLGIMALAVILLSSVVLPLKKAAVSQNEQIAHDRHREQVEIIKEALREYALELHTPEKP